MTFSDFIDSLLRLDYQRAILYLGQFDVGELARNPVFLGVMGLLAVVCLLMRWRILLATILGVTGLAWLINYTTAGDAALTSLSSKNLITLVTGSVLILIVMIYLVFIKND